jgi:hypothetical protein
MDPRAPHDVGRRLEANRVEYPRDVDAIKANRGKDVIISARGIDVVMQASNPHTTAEAVSTLGDVSLLGTCTASSRQPRASSVILVRQTSACRPELVENPLLISEVNTVVPRSCVEVDATSDSRVRRRVRSSRSLDDSEYTCGTHRSIHLFGMECGA